MSVSLYQYDPPKVNVGMDRVSRALRTRIVSVVYNQFTLTALVLKSKPSTDGAGIPVAVKKARKRMHPLAVSAKMRHQSVMH